MLARDGGQFEIVPANVHWLFLCTNAQFAFFIWYLLFENIVPELGENIISVFKDVLPCADRLAKVRQTFTPDIHGAPVV